MGASAAVNRPGGFKRLIRPAAWAVAAIVGWLVVPDLLTAWWLDLEPPTRLGLTTGFLNSVLVGYGVTLALALIGVLVAGVWLIRSRHIRGRRIIPARILLLGMSLLLSLAAVEAGAWGLEWQRRSLAVSNVKAVPEVGSPAAGSVSTSRGGDLVMLVLGESSAEGQPFQEWTSIGHMVAWQLERARPGRRVRVVMRATGGVTLSHMLPLLERETERPDLVLLYSGHNEFQARWGWTRVVDHYRDDSSRRARDTLIDRVGSWTPLCRLVRDAFEHQRVDYDPPPREVRAAADRPVCEPEIRASIRDEFENGLETVARWCERRGALPVFFVPAGNDAGLDPDRTVLSPETSQSDRQQFAHDLQETRADEAVNPDRALAAYRRLLERQPGAADVHYRMARLLQQAGRIDEASESYARARDLDGLPMRCPSEFQEAYRSVAARHDLVLVESPKVLRAVSPSGLLDDNVFLDAQHPTFRGYLALAQDVVYQLKRRGEIAMSGDAPSSLDPQEIAHHFGIGTAQWATVCRRSSLIWRSLAKLRFEGAHRTAQSDRFWRAAERLDAGETPESLRLPGLGTRPPGFR